MIARSPVRLPQLIAICGNPGAGKSEVQNVLKGWGVIAVDDGRPMRRFAMDYLGLSEADVYTAEGKGRCSEILGREWGHRELLGELGNALEAMFGPFIMPFMATRRLDPGSSYSFGSVRRDQARFYKALGGAIVLGVRRPGVGPSPYEFDQFDPSLVDHWIDNDGTLGDLAARVEACFRARAADDDDRGKGRRAGVRQPGDERRRPLA